MDKKVQEERASSALIPQTAMPLRQLRALPSGSSASRGSKAPQQDANSQRNQIVQSQRIGVPQSSQPNGGIMAAQIMSQNQIQSNHSSQLNQANLHQQQNSIQSHQSQGVSSKKKKAKSVGKEGRSQNNQRKNKPNPHQISQFDKLEEARYKSYEAGQTLSQLCDLINCQNQKQESFISLSNESWREIRFLASQAQNMFSSSSHEWDEIVDNLTQDLQHYKHLSQRLKSKIEDIKRLERRHHEDTLKDIASAYNKNRTQMFNVIDEIELSIHDHKNAIEKRNVKQLGYMTQFEKDIQITIDDAISEANMLTSHSVNHQNLPFNSHSSRNEINLPLQKQHQSLQQLQPHQPNSNQQQSELITPRTNQITQQQQLSGRRGRSQQPLQKDSILPPQHPNMDHNKRVNIPLLPIHMINSNSHQNLHSGRNPGIPPTGPGSQRSNMQQLSSRRHHNYQIPGHHHDQASGRGGNVSQRGANQQQLSARNSSSRYKEPSDSKRSIQGAIIDGYLVNPVFLGAVYQTSHFDRALEDDYEGAEQTLSFETDRLKQYGEEYQMLMEVQDEEKRILVKQFLYMIHEKELKAQAKQEKALRVQQRRALRAQQAILNPNNRVQSFDGTTPRSSAPNLNENDETMKDEPSMDPLMNQNDSMTGSHISLQRGQLPFLNTNELLSARRNEYLNEVQLDQLLDVPQEIHGLIKTATEKSIILKIEKEFQEKEDLLREDRKVLEWSSKHGSQNQGNSFISDFTPIVEDNGSGNAESNTDKKLRKLFSNGAMNIMDQKMQKVGQAIVGELSTPKQGQSRSNQEEFESPGENSSEPSLNQSLKVELLNQPSINHKARLNPGPIKQNFIFPQEEMDQEDYKNLVYVENYQNINQQLIDQLEVIHERQSELSSSINTNNKRLSTQRNQKQGVAVGANNNNNMIMMMPPHNGRRASNDQQRVLSARESSSQAYNNVIDMSRLQHLQQQPSQQQLQYLPSILESVGTQQNQDEFIEEKFKRYRSHRKSLQSAPNSQRGGMQNNQVAQNPSENYRAGQFNVEENSFTDGEGNQKNDLQAIQIQPVKKIKEQKKRPVTELRQHHQKFNQDNLSDSFDENINFKEAVLYGKNQLFARRHSPMINESFLLQQQCPQHFSSIQNQFEESKTSGYKNESLFLNDSSLKFVRSPKAISDKAADNFKDNDELCDFDDVDLNQLHQLYNKFVPLSAILGNNNSQTKPEELKSGQSPFQQNKMLPNTNSQSLRHHFLQNNINSSLYLLGNQSNQSAAGLLFPSGTQKHNQSNLLQSRGLTANMITNYLLQNFTQLKLVSGQLTREVPTSKKQNDNQKQSQHQIHGQSGFTLSTLGDETLMYMFPAQKTQRRTLFMLQNFHNNYYNNQAGVLFTMPISTGEINNGFLQQCSTVPSGVDQDICSGGMTQSQTKHIGRHIRQNNQMMINSGGINHQPHGTQDSLMIKGSEGTPFDPRNSILQQKGIATHHQIMNAMSTGESGTMKSSSFGGHQLFRFNPQAVNTQKLSSNQVVKGATAVTAVAEATQNQSNELSLSPRHSFDNNPDNISSDKLTYEAGVFQKDQKFKRANSFNPKSNKTTQDQKIKLQQIVPNLQINQDSSQSKLGVFVSQGYQSKSGGSDSQRQNSQGILGISGNHGVFNRNIKIIYNPQNNQSNNGGLAKLQAIAGSAHNSAVSQNGGANLIIKKPNIVRIQKTQQVASNAAGHVEQSQSSISRIIQQ